MYVINLKLKTLKKAVSIIMVLTVFISAVVFAGSILSEDIKVPVIMYHQVLKNEKMWGEYVVSPELFEEDLRYLKEKGYTPVFVKDLVDFVYENKKLPEKPVVLSFDDGHLSILHYVLPILTIIKSGLIEIGNHTYSFHNLKPRMGMGIKKGEDEIEYIKLISDDLKKLNKKIKEKTGVIPVTFTYPFGKVSNASLDTVEKNFKASLSCEEGITGVAKGDYDSLYLIKRYNRPSGISTEEFFKKIKI